MKRIVGLAVIALVALVGGAWFWASHPPAYAVTIAQRIDHHYVVAAYAITWFVQLSYLTFIGLKWQQQKRIAARLDRDSR